MNGPFEGRRGPAWKVGGYISQASSRNGAGPWQATDVEQRKRKEKGYVPGDQALLLILALPRPGHRRSRGLD